MAVTVRAADIETHVRDLEHLRGWFIEALEIGAGMVDTGASLRDGSDPFAVLREIGPRLRELFGYRKYAFLRVDEESYDFKLYDCFPEEERPAIAAEIDQQIERGAFSWALTQTRPVLVRGRDGCHNLVMQVIATRSRIRGMFVGFLEEDGVKLRDALQQVLSMILSNAANAIENHELYRYIHEQNRGLERIVEERTAALEHARAEAEAANEAKSRFIANMSHEIRTPLTSIIGFAEMLRDQSLSEPERRDAITTIYSTGRHLLEIINDILDLSKLNSNRLQFEIVRTSLFDIVAQVTAVIDMHARQKGLDFRINYHFPLPREIETDPTRLAQILLNLCSNAVKFTEQGKVEIDVCHDPERHSLRFSVADTGVGLSPEQQQRLFQAFSQADASTTRKFGGTGLGLIISKQLAELLGGTITVSSALGRGSTFTVSVGCGSFANSALVDAVPERCEPGNESNPDSNTGAALQSGLRGRVLLAEDDPNVRRLIRLYLRGTDIEIAEVENGRDAVEQALAGDYDLLITDLQMPEMGGLEAVEWLRKTGFGRPVIALSASAMGGERERCIAAGCNDFLTKPLDRSGLLTKLGSCLASGAAAAGDTAQALGEDPGYREAREQFIASLEPALPRWRDLRDAADWEQIRAMAHRLKGSAGGFGWQALGEQAGRVESAVIEGRLEQAAEHCAGLIREIEQALQQSTGEHRGGAHR